MILVIGSINMDIALNVKCIPSPGQTVISNSSFLSPGGKGANQAVAAAKLGGEVVFLGCVGNDTYGDQLLTSLQDAGVNTDYVIRADNTCTSTAYICVSESGENAIVVQPSANRLVTPEYLSAHIDLFEKADYCLLQMEIPDETVKKAIVLSHLFGTKVVLNPSPLEYFETSILDGVDYVIANEDEALTLIDFPSCVNVSADDWIHFMRCHGIKHMVVTLRENGSHYYCASGVDRHFSTTARDAVDSTGAGDAFLGAFTVALSNGSDIETAITYANVTAGISVMGQGAQSSYPTREQVDAEIEGMNL